MTKVQLTTEEVMNNYRNGAYDVPESTDPKLKKLRDTHIEDENKSVKWNKEFVVQNNEAYFQQIQDARKKQDEATSRLHQDLVEAVAYEHHIKEDEASLIYWHSYRENHSSGFHDIISGVDDLVDLIEKVKELHDI